METKGITIQITAEMDDDVKALVAGYKGQNEALRKENDLLRFENRQLKGMLGFRRDVLSEEQKEEIEEDA